MFFICHLLSVEMIWHSLPMFECQPGAPSKPSTPSWKFCIVSCICSNVFRKKGPRWHTGALWGSPASRRKEAGLVSPGATAANSPSTGYMIVIRSCCCKERGQKAESANLGVHMYIGRCMYMYICTYLYINSIELGYSLVNVPAFPDSSAGKTSKWFSSVRSTTNSDPNDASPPST